MTFEAHLFWKHNLTPDAVELADTEGYWTVKGGCPGGDKCKHAWRPVLGACEPGTRITIRYAEWGARDAKGRFVSPYREWHRQQKLKQEKEKEL